MHRYNPSDFLDLVIKKNINYFFSSASFENRCFTTSLLVKELKYNSKIFFNSNEYEHVCNNALLMQQMLDGELVKLDTLDPVGNYNSILNVINSLENNANILIDSTTFTHETLLVLIKLLDLFKRNIGSIFIAYVGAKEYSVNIDREEDKWLSKGIRDIRTVIGFPGFSDPTQKNHLLVLFGFESERTQKLINEYQYDFVTLGFGDEAIEDVHLKINHDRHRILLKEYSHAKPFSFSLTDPAKTKDQILSFLDQKEYRNLNTVIAPLNNKLSTIGAGLAAITNDNIQLAYTQAKIYNIDGYSITNSDIYFFEMQF